MEINLLDIGLRTHEILENALEFQLTGHDDYGSGTTLATTPANITGTLELLTILHPLLVARYAGLPAVYTWLGRLQTAAQVRARGRTASGSPSPSSARAAASRSTRPAARRCRNWPRSPPSPNRGGPDARVPAVRSTAVRSTASEPASRSAAARRRARPAPRRAPRRRAFLRGALGAGVAGAVAGAAGGYGYRATRPAPASQLALENAEAGLLPPVPFHGKHQAGILPQPQRQTAVIAFNVTADGRGELTDLLRTITERARFLTTGGTPPPVGIARRRPTPACSGRPWCRTG